MVDLAALGVMPVAVDHRTAAQMVALSSSRLRHHVRLGDVTPHFTGTKPIYLVSDLQEFVKQLPTRPEHLTATTTTPV